MQILRILAVLAAGLTLAGFVQPDETFEAEEALFEAREEPSASAPAELEALPEPADAPTDPALESYIDGLLDVYRATYRAPGYGVAVVSAEKDLLIKGYGLADVEEGLAVSPDETRWHVASISKTFVWTSVMMLVERGALDLDTDVNTYLKGFEMPAGDKPLTLNMIMAHRSGLEDEFTLFAKDIQDTPRLAAMEQTRPAQVYDRGTVRAYSNWATNLAALIIDDVTGSYDDFLFTEILEPLGMTGTTLGTKGAAYEQLAAGKNYSVTPWGPEDDGQFDSGSFAPLGGMTITTSDMAKWMRFHLGRGALDGVRLMQEETYALMRTRAFEDDSLGADMAHGFSDQIFRGLRIYGHSGSINSVYSVFMVAPDLDRGVFLVQNSHTTYTPLSQIAPLFFAREMELRGLEQDGVRDDAPTGDAAVAAAEELAGSYVASRRPHTGFAKAFTIFDATEITAQDGAIIIGGGGGGAYQPIGADTWENPLGSRLHVERAADGSVIGVQDSFGASMLLPMCVWEDPKTFFVPLIAVVGFLVTTVLGFWRRLGRPDYVSGTGRVLSFLTLASAGPMIWFGLSARAFSVTEEQSFAELMTVFPPQSVITLSLASSFVAATGGVMLLSLLPAWKGSGYSIWRKLHHSLLALSYGAFGAALIHWRFAFSDITFA
ncbi:MAG: serine hydrolase domain-containing protein [Pseudomonadota bacterium]